jgi:ribosomal protein S18 acetylase RimI-like enzyme
MPITASTQLAARIDRTELALVLGMAGAVRSTGVSVNEWPVGGTWAVLGEDGSPFNKVIALGYGAAPTADELGAMERGHSAAGVRVQVELSTLADPAVARLLTSRGYQLIGFENVLGRRLDDAPAAAGSIALSEVTADASELWIRTVTDAFIHPDVFDGPESHESFSGDVMERTYRAFAAVPGVSRMLARLGGEAAGGASLYLHDGTAMLCGAATLPAFRRRGVQSALLHARLSQARQAGCDLAVVTTQPGSKSQENVQRAGFELLYARAVLVRDP